MSYSYVARQPILNSQMKNVGYELLFRDGPDNRFPDVDPELATSKLLIDNLINQTHKLFKDKERYFINFTYKSLILLIPALFDKDKVVIEIHEDSQPDRELFRAVKYLKKHGYTLALDDFIPDGNWEMFLPYIDIIKLNLRGVKPEQATAFLKSAKVEHVKFLADKIETVAEYQIAKKAGFRFFQGYFFSKPQMMQTTSIQTKDATALMLLGQLKQDDFSYARLEKIVVTDVALAYQLLRFVNNGYIKTDQEITSFKQALIFLGERNIRKFISLIVLAQSAKHKPQSLYSLSLERAFMCEEIAKKTKPELADEAFLVGLFSLLAAFLDAPMTEILKALPLSNTAKIALVKREGRIGDFLKLSIAYGEADWDVVTELREELKLSEEHLIQIYQKAVDGSSEYLAI